MSRLNVRLALLAARVEQLEEAASELLGGARPRTQRELPGGHAHLKRADIDPADWTQEAAFDLLASQGRLKQSEIEQALRPKPAPTPPAPTDPEDWTDEQWAALDRQRRRSAEKLAGCSPVARYVRQREDVLGGGL
jgi:hypothetical protein